MTRQPATAAGRELIAHSETVVMDPGLRSAIPAFVERIEAEAAAPQPAEAGTPHPLLVKYGLEGMAGDPIEVLHRHLTNNHEATIGAYKATIKKLREQPAEAVALRHALDRIAAWSRWHKEEARVQIRGTMKLIHEEATAALANQPAAEGRCWGCGSTDPNHDRTCQGDWSQPVTAAEWKVGFDAGWQNGWFAALAAADAVLANQPADAIEQGGAGE